MTWMGFRGIRSAGSESRAMVFQPLFGLRFPRGNCTPKAGRLFNIPPRDYLKINDNPALMTRLLEG